MNFDDEKRKIFFKFKEADNTSSFISGVLAFVFCGKAFFCYAKEINIKYKTNGSNSADFVKIKNDLFDVIEERNLSKLYEFFKKYGVSEIVFYLDKSLYYGGKNINTINLTEKYLKYLNSFGFLKENEIKLNLVNGIEGI